MIDVPSVVTAASVFAGALFEHERSDKSAFRPFSLDVSAFIAYPNKLRALFGFKLGLNENVFFWQNVNIYGYLKQSALLLRTPRTELQTKKVWQLLASRRPPLI